MTDNSMVCAGIDVSKTRLDVALHPLRIAPGTVVVQVQRERAIADALRPEAQVLEAIAG